LVRKDFKIKKNIHKSSESLRKMINLKDLKQGFTKFKRNNASISIQKYWRAFIARKTLKKLKKQKACKELKYKFTKFY